MKLRAPTEGAQLSKGGKYHLPNPRRSVPGFTLTVCGVYTRDPFDVAALPDLTAKQVCVRCLGPFEAVPE